MLLSLTYPFAAPQLIPQALELFLVAGLIASSGSVPLAGVAVGTVISYACFTVAAVERRLRYLEKMNSADNEATSRILEALLAYETVVTHNKQGWEVNRYDDKLGRYQVSALKSQESLALLNWGQKAIESVGIGLMLLITSKLMLQGSMTLGRLVMLNTLLVNMLQPLVNMP
jgi:ATP-binding cassette, subfamily B, heavy metal transporter